MFTGQMGTLDSVPGYSLSPGQAPANGGETEAAAASNLSLTSAATYNLIAARLVSSDLTVVQAAVPVRKWEVSAHSTLVLTQDCQGSIAFDLYSLMSLSQTARANAVRNLSATSSLALNQSARVPAERVGNIVDHTFKVGWKLWLLQES